MNYLSVHINTHNSMDISKTRRKMPPPESPTAAFTMECSAPMHYRCRKDVRTVRSASAAAAATAVIAAAAAAAVTAAIATAISAAVSAAVSAAPDEKEDNDDPPAGTSAKSITTIHK